MTVHSGRYVLRSTTADGLPLYFGEAGPTIARENAIEYPAHEVEQRRANAALVLGLKVEAVEVGSARDGNAFRPAHE